MMLLAINWSEAGIKACQFILSFSIIVVLHEMGHYLPAKWFKCRVEKFFLFFNPGFSLFKKKIGETEYGLGWIPFGGYVKISGMIDESMDKEQMGAPAKPWEFRSKPAWQRLIIMLGGVTVNLILGFVIYAAMLWYWGDSYLPSTALKYGIATDSLAQSIGLRNGDKIRSVDGRTVEKFDKIRIDIILRDAKTLEIDRGGQPMTIHIPEDFASNVVNNSALDFLDVRFPFGAIDSVAKGGPAEKAGLQKGDRIVAVNGTRTEFFNDYKTEIAKNRSKQVSFAVVRGEDTLQRQATIPADGISGVYSHQPDSLFNFTTVHYSFFQAIPAGFSRSIETLQSYWLQLKLITKRKVNTSKSIGSVISIGKMYKPTWDWPSFWALTALFSIILAFMNVLPIPALDGGHALFTLYEMVSGRKPSEKFIEYAQVGGMALMFGLMAYALGMDIFRLFK